MATNALRTLLALFDVDTGSAETKLKGLSASIETVKGALGTIAGSLAGAFSFGAVKDFIEEQIELGSKLNDTAEKLGVGTDELQKFQMAAGLTGVGADEAGKALQFLNRNMGEALDGNKEAVQAFTKLGVSLKDGQGEVRELGDVIPEVADAFEKMGSDQERTVVAMKLFGKSGAALIPLLKGGGQGLREMNEEFEALGLGIDEDFIKKADEAGDQIDILKLGFRALKTRIAVDVLPGITEWAKKLQTAIVWMRGFIKETNAVKYVWGLLTVGFAAGAAKMAVSWGKTLGLLKGNVGIVKTIFSLGEFGLILFAIIGIGIALEDLFTMVNGGESVIGDFLTKTFGIEYTRQLVDSLRKSWEDLQPALEDLKPILADVMSAFAKGLPYVIALVVDAVRVVTALGVGLKFAAEAIADIASGAATGDWSPLTKDSNAAADRIWDEKSGLLSRFTTADLINRPAMVPGSSLGAADFAPGVTVGDTTINVTVPGGSAQDGRRIASFVRDGVDGSDMAAALASLQKGPE